MAFGACVSVMLLSLLTSGFPLLPNLPYEWSISDFDNVPDWEIPNVFEVKVHKDDENYAPTCTIDSPYANVSCKLRDALKDPPSPFKACRIVISEVNADNPGSSQENVFVELEEICWNNPRQQVKTLKGFKLVIVEGVSNSMVMVIDLKNVALSDKDPKDPNRNRFVVIGTDTVSNVNVKFVDENVQSVFNYPNSPYAFPFGDTSPFSVLLVYSAALRELQDINLQVIPGVGYYEKRVLDETLIAKLGRLGQDMVVFGRKVPTNRCDIFERLWFNERVLNPKLFYLLRDWDASDDSKQDLSLNRCSGAMLPFLPNAFKLGIPTPGDPNDCTGARFILEEHVYDVSNTLQPDLEPVDLPSACTSDQINMPNERYKRVNEDLYLQARDDAMVKAKRQCLEDPGPEGQYAEKDAIADINIERIQELNGAPLTPPYDKKNFDPDWIEAGKPFLPEGSSILEDPVFQAWLRLRTDESGQLKFFCDVCATQIDMHFHIERNRVKEIMKRTGFIHTDIAANEREIANHLVSDIHGNAEGYLREIYSQESKELVYALLENEESYASKLLLPTVRMIRSVYMETSSGISFRKHVNVVNLQKANGVPLGIHAYHKKAASDISEIISNFFHDNLLDSLVKNDMDFALLVDSSTDSRNIHYLVVFIQTLENNRPTIYFYRLIELDEGESAQATMNSLWKKVVEDSSPDRNVEDYFLRRLVVFASDGANVMIGKRESLHALLMKKLGRNIPSIICMAHKLQNAIKRGIKKSGDPDLEYFEKFENEINKFYNFYSSRGSKRWSHFEDTARELGIDYRRIKYFFEVRWSSSQYSALYNIFKDYVALYKDTESISQTTDRSFTYAAKQTAGSLFLTLQDKTWSLILHYLLDILNIYKDISLDLQNQAGTLPGKYKIIQRAVDSINALRSNVGAFTESFLKSCACRTRRCRASTCTIQEYDTCETVIYTSVNKGVQTQITLRNTLPNTINLSQKSNALLDSLIGGLHHYFNLDDLQHFELFNQKLYVTPDCDLPQNSIFWRPHSNNVIPMDAPDHITYLTNFYGMSEEQTTEIIGNWDEFYRQLITNPSYVRNLKSEFEYFWTLVLKNERDELKNFPNSLRSLVQKMLVTPFSTAECERAFSIMTNTLYKRHSMSAETLERQMRVSINGNTDYFQFRVLPATKTYLRTHARVDDNSFRGGRPLEARPWSKLLPKSALF